MKKFKVFLLTVLCVASWSVFGQTSTFSDFQKATITDINTNTSMVYINNRAYLYKPDKKISLYQTAKDIEPVDIRDLKTDTEYYVEIIYEEKRSAGRYSEVPKAVVFIAEQAPPE